jgi:hypothetical protein
MSFGSHPFFETRTIRPPIKVIPNFISNINTFNPEFDLSNNELSFSNVKFYSVDLETAGTKVPYTGNTYVVDLSGVDNRGSNIDLTGEWIGSNARPIHMANFQVRTGLLASKAPGSEFTIFFKNVPLDFPDGPPFVTIGLVPEYHANGYPQPYLFSPPNPNVTVQNNTGRSYISPSLTFKSDGDNYNVVSSGPASWLGFYNFIHLTGTAPL